MISELSQSPNRQEGGTGLWQNAMSTERAVTDREQPFARYYHLLREENAQKTYCHKLAEHLKGFGFLWWPGLKFLVEFMNLFLQSRPNKIPCCTSISSIPEKTNLMFAIYLQCSKTCWRRLLPRILTQPNTACSSTLLLYASKGKKSTNQFCSERSLQLF